MNHCEALIGIRILNCLKHCRPACGHLRPLPSYPNISQQLLQKAPRDMQTMRNSTAKKSKLY